MVRLGVVGPIKCSCSMYDCMFTVEMEPIPSTSNATPQSSVDDENVTIGNSTTQESTRCE